MLAKTRERIFNLFYDVLTHITKMATIPFITNASPNPITSTR